MEPKNVYYAWVSNEQGAREDVQYSRGNSKTNAIREARKQYGPGWTVHIMTLPVDGDGQSVMCAEEIGKFTIR